MTKDMKEKFDGLINQSLKKIFDDVTFQLEEDLRNEMFDDEDITEYLIMILKGEA